MFNNLTAAKIVTIFVMAKFRTFFVIFMSFFKGSGAVTLHVENIP